MFHCCTRRHGLLPPKLRVIQGGWWYELLLRTHSSASEEQWSCLPNMTFDASAPATELPLLIKTLTFLHSTRHSKLWGFACFVLILHQSAEKIHLD